MDQKLLEDYRLLRVGYGTDRGLVSLTTGDLLAVATNSCNFGTSSELHTVYVEDHQMEAIYGEEHNWNDVIKYLQQHYVWETKSLNETH